MDTLYENEIDIRSNEADLYYEPVERTSDIELPPAMNTLLLATWILVSLIGFAVIFLAKNPVAGTIIIAVPTLIGMVIKPTFALCIMMLVLPTGAGIGYKQTFSLDRAIGIALAVSFLLNILITRPRLRIGNRALWVIGLYTLWVILSSLAAPYFGLEMRRAFTQVQLLALVLIVYWILQTNSESTFRWALRAFVIGTLGTALLAFMSGAAMRTMESAEARYAATLGEAIDPNMLAALTSIAFLTAIYLFARDRNLWRVVHLAAILFLPIMLLWIGSRGALIAMAFTLLSPLLFIRQVVRRPLLALLLLAAIALASVSAGLLIESGELQAPVLQRLTDVGYAIESIRTRMQPIGRAVEAVTEYPAGTGYYSWFERAGTRIWPHNDFFLVLGVYGIPAGLLLVTLVIMLILTVRRIPLTPEKLYARAVLTFLLIMGLNIGQVFKKYYWLFFVIVLLAERIGWLYTDTLEELPSQADEEETADIDDYAYVSP